MALIEAADRIEAFTVSVAAGVLQAAPASTDISFAPGEVIGVDIRIPAGHNGATGIQLAQAHTPIVPSTSGAFIVGDDDRLEWPLEGLSNAGNWQAICFNTGHYTHRFFVRFHVRDLARPQLLQLSPSPLALA